MPVKGRLSYQGQPLYSYRVTLWPEKGDRASSGLTDQEGNFRIGTNREGDGAPVGRFRVTVAYEPPTSADNTADVPIDDPRMLPKPEIKVPAKYSNPDSSSLILEVPAEGVPNWELNIE